jgi:hypothetical protein
MIALIEQIECVQTKQRTDFEVTLDVRSCCHVLVVGVETEGHVWV